MFLSSTSISIFSVFDLSYLYTYLGICLFIPCPVLTEKDTGQQPGHKPAWLAVCFSPRLLVRFPSRDAIPTAVEFFFVTLDR